MGVEIIRDRAKKSLIITQRSLVSKILTKYNKLENKVKIIPIPLGINLSKNLENSKIEDITRYQQGLDSNLSYYFYLAWPSTSY